MSNAKQATPHSALIAELMDSRVPKTEREHAAIREIETLRERLAQKDEPNAEPIQPNEVLFAVEIPEGYEETHLELLGEDVFAGKQWVRWRVVPTDEPSAEPVYCSCGDQIVQDDDPKCGTCVSLLQKDEPSAEPVAWFHKDFGSVELSRIRRSGWSPLYAAPPTRAPLTDEQIDDGMERALLSPAEQQAFGAGVRYAERKHGIGEKK